MSCGARVARLGGDVSKYHAAMKRGGFVDYQDMLTQLGIEDNAAAQALFNETQQQEEEQKHRGAVPPLPRAPIVDNAQAARWDNAVANDRKALRDEAERARRERDEAQARLYNARFDHSRKSPLSIVMPWETTNYDDIVDYVKKEKLKKDVIRELADEKRARRQRSMSPRKKTRPRKPSKSPKPKAKSKSKTKAKSKSK